MTGAILAAAAVVGDAPAQSPASDMYDYDYDPARAQSSASELYDPAVTIDSGNPPSFSRNGIQASDEPGRLRSVLTDGNAPPSGAGSTGFVSTSPPPAARARVSGDGPLDRTGSTLPLEPAVDDQIVAPAPPRAGRRPIEAAAEDPYEPLGLRLGSFVVKPAVEISGGYDSNPERTPTGSGGGVVTVAPELRVRSDWSRHELRVDVLGRYKTYPGFTATPSLNQPFVDSKVAARIDVTRRTRIGLEGRFELSTEAPNSPDLPADVASLPVTITGGVTAGVTQRFNRLEVGVAGSFDRTVWADSTLTTGATASNADRNYDQYGVTLRGSYELRPGVKPFIEAGADRRTYDLPVDAGGVNRNSTGNELRIGTTFELTRLLTGSASIGYATRTYQDPTLKDLHGLIGDGSLVWTATPLTKVTFSARSHVNESTLTNVSGVLEQDFGVQVDHAFRRWLIGTMKFGYGLDDYVGSARVDESYAIAGLLTYKLSRDVQIKGEARREWLTSNVASAEYAANIFLLGIRLQR